jgi:hypothetical protein
MHEQTWSARCREACRCAVSGGVPQRSLAVAIGGAPMNWVKVLLTFAVPYCVSTYGAVSFRLSLMRPPS